MRKKNRYTGLFSIPIICLLLIASCAMNSIYLKEAKDLYQADQYDEAVKYFEKALKEKPNSTEIKRLLFRAKLNSYYHHLLLARKYKDVNKKDKAIKEYQIALMVFPNNKQLEEELNTYTKKKKAKKEVFKSTIKPPVVLNVDTKEKVSLNLKSAPITKIFKMLGKSYKINIIFDKDFRDFVYNLDIENIGFYDVLNQLCLISNSKYRILDRSSIIIYPNTVYKKRTFELMGVKIFYLSNMKAENTKKLLQVVFRGQNITFQEDTDLNCLIVKASSNELMEVEKFINHIDKQKSEVEMDVEILEVNRNFLKKIGLDLGLENILFTAGEIKKAEPTSGESETSNSTSSNDSLQTTVNIKDLKNTNFFLTLPAATLDFLETDGNNKIIAKPNLRGLHGEEIKFMVGDEIPIPQTSYQAMAAGGITNIPLTQFTYKNVGVEIKVTPFIHNNNEVTLKIKLTMNFISGYTMIGEAEMPSLGKRELENVIRLKEGETSIIGGFIKDEERRSLSGTPALSKIPIIGYLFGSSQKSINQTDLIFSITPRIIKKTNIKSQDLDPIWTNTLSAFQGEGIRREFEEPGGPDIDEPMRRRELNSIVISPSKRRVPVNNLSYFTIRMNTNQRITSLSLSGSLSGGKATIEEMQTDFFKSDKVKVFKNYSSDSFDLGYSFQDGAPKSSVLAQLKIKFLEKGNYTISISNFNADSMDKKAVDMKTSSTEVQVY